MPGTALRYILLLTLETSSIGIVNKMSKASILDFNMDVYLLSLVMTLNQICLLVTEQDGRMLSTSIGMR